MREREGEREKVKRKRESREKKSKSRERKRTKKECGREGKRGGGRHRDREVQREMLHISTTFLTGSSASLADLNLLPCCWFILAQGASLSTTMKRSFCGFIILNRTSG